jgi:DHA1 family tetracycline resistance protein-like MFS transporter
MDRRLITILLIVFVQMLGAAMILPILPLFAQREFDVSPQLITLLSTSFFAAQFLAGPFLGRLSDNYGRVPILIISQIGTAVSFLMLALAPSAGFLFLARILDGITGGNIIVAQAYITDITPRRKRTEALGYIFAVFGLGFVIGPALGALLSAAIGPRLPYVIAAIAAIAVVFLTWFTLEETLSPEQRQANQAASGNSMNLREIVRNKALLLILLVAFLGQSGLGILQSTFALYGEAVLFQGYSSQAVIIGIGLLLTTVGLGQFTTQAFLLRPLLAWYGEHRLIIIGNISRMLAAFLFALAVTPWLGAISSLLFAFGIGIMMPSLQSLATGTVDDKYRGGILGIYQSTLSLSIIVSSAGAGVLFVISATMPYWVSGILAALALIPAFILLLQYGQKRGETTPTIATKPDKSPDTR